MSEGAAQPARLIPTRVSTDFEVGYTENSVLVVNVIPLPSVEAEEVFCATEVEGVVVVVANAV